MSVRLRRGRSYPLSFNANPIAKTCVARLTDLASGTDVPAVLRQGKGAQVSGSLGVTPGCTPDPAIDRL